MPAYHSVFTNNYSQKACEFPLCEFKSNKKPNMDVKFLKSIDNTFDIIDEAIIYFRGNVLFKSYAINNDTDKVIIYLTVFISKCLETVYNNQTNLKKAKEMLVSLVSEAEFSTTNKTHFLNNILTINNSQVPDLQKYLKSIRQETVNRLITLWLEGEDSNVHLKHWFSYSKKKFLGYEMPIVRKY